MKHSRKLLGMVFVVAAAASTDAAAQKPPIVPKPPPGAPALPIKPPAPPTPKGPPVGPVATPGPVTVSPGPATVAPRKERVVNSGENNIRNGSMLVSNSAPDVQGTPLLTGFRLRFGNGDHKIRTLGVRAQMSSTLMSMADQNNDDVFNAAASWIEVSGAQSDLVAAHGGGQFTVPLPRGKVPGHRVVLTGFDFIRSDGTDANIRSVGVWLDDNTGTVTFSLLDDQGADFRRIAEDLAKGLVAGAPDLGLFVGLSPKNSRSAGRLPPAGKFRPYVAQVQFAYVPESYFSGQETFTGTGRSPSSGRTFPARSVLQGFEFFFDNGDHHLLDLGVMTPLAEPFFRTRTSTLPIGPGEVVFFQDNNRDDPIRWTVRTLTMTRP